MLNIFFSTCRQHTLEATLNDDIYVLHYLINIVVTMSVRVCANSLLRQYWSSNRMAKTFPNSEDDDYKALHAESFFFYVRKEHVSRDPIRR